MVVARLHRESLDAPRLPPNGQVSGRSDSGPDDTTSGSFFCHLNLTPCGDTKLPMWRDVSFRETSFLDGRTQYETVWLQSVWTDPQGCRSWRRTDAVGFSGSYAVLGPVCRL